MNPANLCWGRPPERRMNGTGALMLAGSSGRIDTARVEMLTGRGVTALGMRWFGGPGLPATPAYVPLELVSDGVDALLVECDRVVLIGLSYGAEAVLLSATTDHRPAAVVALAPTDVAWEGHIDQGAPPAAKFTTGGTPRAFIPHDRTWPACHEGENIVEWYRHSRREADAGTIEAATIEIERFPGDVVLVAGGDDQVWPSVEHAAALARRRAEAALSVDLIVDARAGHRIVLPGEHAPDQSRAYAVGGNTGAPQRLGRRAWPSIARVLHVEGE